MTVEYLPIATAPGNNADSQANFAGSGYQTLGFQAGVAISLQVNKCLRQSSMVAAAIANFIANKLGINVIDDGNLPVLITNLTNALAAGGMIAPSFQMNGSPNPSQTVLNLISGQNITLTRDNNGGLAISAPAAAAQPDFRTNGTLNNNQSELNLMSSPTIAAQYDGNTAVSFALSASIQAIGGTFLKTLGGNVGASANTLTHIDSQQITFPTSGGPWRVFGAYSYFMNGGVGWMSGMFDGASWFGASHHVVQNNNSVLAGASFSTGGPYANGSTVTFHVYVFGDGNGTVVPFPSGMGSPGRVYGMGQSYQQWTILSTS